MRSISATEAFTTPMHPGLLAGGGVDLANDVGHALDAADDLCVAARWRLHMAHATVHGLHAGLDQALDLAGCLGAALRQRAHPLASDHGKAAALLAGAGRLHGGVQRQDVGLEGDGVNQGR